MKISFTSSEVRRGGSFIHECIRLDSFTMVCDMDGLQTTSTMKPVGSESMVKPVYGTVNMKEQTHLANS
eukprot:gene14742-4369_t